ncbi:cytidylyltransferase family-domain-containing protein [Spinellus fusiger]|nr:cytidylyltransferase family-domain-containing protein [Spinellus fusiger]
MESMHSHAIVLALYASLAAPFGGLLASSLKRANGLKDFDQCIPGHGGVTDRVDCQLLMPAFTYFYCNYVLSNVGNATLSCMHSCP